MDIPLFATQVALQIQPIESIVNQIITPDTTYVYYILYGVVALFFVLSVFSLSFIAYFESEFFSLTANEVAEVKISSDPKFNRLKTLSEDPLRTLGSVIVARYFTITLMLLTGNFLLYNGLETLGWHKALILAICFILLLALFFLTTEFIPENMLKKENPYTICRGASIVTFFALVFSPLVKYMISSTGVVERRLESRTQRSASIDDISDALNMKAESADDKEMLRGMVNFGKTSVDEIMQPRVDIVDVDYESDFETVLKTIRESEYSRLPVYCESIDYVKGILYIKDFLQYTDQNKDFKWQSYIREPYFVPENKKIDDLFKEFQKKHIHMAIVVDEFGGTAGIVTMEDIIEVIVGDICDEHDEEENQIVRLNGQSYLLDGKLLLSDFYRLENVEKEVFEPIEGDADTLAGLILEMKGYIPMKGEKIEVGKYSFEIVSDDKRRIREVKLSIKEV